ncbi:Flp pilus assembly protein CpaB, partial [Pseudorhodoplanes sp.]|uniref:Flp pilus assembly protein CpaB n=1 Tax=Pseudorhodoplanes sp. TaxID=1934341 RepID=UPI002C512013
VVVRKSTIVMVAFAVVFGLLAVFIAQAWLNGQAERRLRSLEAQKKPVATNTIVVAAQRLPFGLELAREHLREVPWSAEAMPQGSYKNIGELLSAGKRIVLSPVEPNEPVLSVKMTGPGQRATLSAIVGDGMKAVSVRVNDVEGVGGFVLPGDRVDVVLTRQLEKGNATTEVVLQNARVLAVDQSADDRASKAAVAKAVTLEVDTVGAQKIWLAASVGSLSLLLRKAGEVSAEPTRRVTLDDLSKPERMSPEKSTSTTSVSVQRGGQRQSYEVPVEGTGNSQLASGGTKARGQ